ncbi:MAG: MurR/RpiR family transcriptional regulator [Rhodomicrobium sp.]
MDQSPLKEKIIEAFQTMPAQLKAAARYVLEHPQDVALLTMREQARQAKLQPATMTRFAKHLGLEGYDALRTVHADALRSGALGFSSKASSQVTRQRLKGGKALAAEMIASVGREVAALSAPDMVSRFDAMAKWLVGARRVYCLGLRSSHAVAWHLHYIMCLCGVRSTYLESAGGTGADALAGATPKDVLFAVSVLPYTRATVELAEYAAGQSIPVLAITDSEVAPLARIAENAIIVSTQSPSFLHTMSPAFVAAEMLGALVAGRRGEGALNALRHVEHHLSALKTHLNPRNSKRPT